VGACLAFERVCAFVIASSGAFSVAAKSKPGSFRYRAINFELSETLVGPVLPVVQKRLSHSAFEPMPPKKGQGRIGQIRQRNGATE